ncbi:MAG: hypothetical protein AVO35_04010 [Candidatus Aegiribacteria sp. MLS_C]|nr:MAG: hypothetical protein AVO35_04010 [Candidatus Aegiribacteria sp. MLS_C]
MRYLRVDLRSDTVSTPCHSMRNAMARAEVGDDVFGEDPSVNHLEELVAEMTGFDRAVFMPTGTMSNGVAIRTIAAQGDEVICGSRSHVYVYENAQYAALGGIQMHRVDEDGSGSPPPKEVEELLSRGDDQHHAPRTLVTLEDTHNIMGGLVMPQERKEQLLGVCRARGVPLYLDGARAWHAAVTLDVTLRELLSGYRMVSMCFSKALGSPAGSILLCSDEDEKRVRFLRKQHGGGMRQAGILAAACIYALEHNLPHLERTHRYARSLARGISRSRLLKPVNPDPQSNIVIADTPEGKAQAIVEALADLDIGCLALSPSRLRFVTHLSLSVSGVKYAADILSAFGG